jgi:hypothetical protein
MKMRTLAAACMFIMLLPGVMAAGVGDAFDFVAENLHDVITNVYIVYFATFVLFFVFLYAIYAAALRKVSVFAEQGYKLSGLNKAGKMAAVSFALLSSIGIFFYFKSAEAAVEQVAGTIGWLGGIAFAGLVFGMVYYNLRTGDNLHRGAAFAAAGLALIVYGMFADNEAATMWGTVILIITAIWAGIHALAKGEGGVFGQGRRGGNGDVIGTGGDGDQGAGTHARVGPNQVTNFRGQMQE